MSLWGSLKSTIIDFSAAQFGDIEVLKESVVEKLGKLNSFDRYCLLEYLQNSDEEIFTNPLN